MLFSAFQNFAVCQAAVPTGLHDVFSSVLRSLSFPSPVGRGRKFSKGRKQTSTCFCHPFGFLKIKV
jgi:hypothetical protein